MISVTLDVANALATLTAWEQTQVPFAMANTLNDLAVDFQTQEFLHEADIFTLRRPDWVRRSNKITHFANKAELFATVTVSPPGAPNRADIIGKFESETEKTSIRPGGLLAVPIGARRGKTNVILPSQRPKAFNFRQVGKRILGDKGTFIVTLADGRQMILQRHGKNQVQALYVLTPQVPITPDLEYLKTAEWTVANRFQQRFDARWQQALATGIGGSAARAAYTDDPVAFLTSRGYSIV